MWLNFNPLFKNRHQFKTKNFKGVLSLLAGNTIAKMIATLGGFVLANYYGPANYGVYKVFLSYVMILPILSTMRLDSIMVLQKGSKEIRNLFSGILVISFVLTFLMVLGMVILNQWQLVDFRLPVSILILTGFGALLTAWNLTQNNLFTKYKLFNQISTSFVIAALFSVVFQMVFYFLGWTETGLIYGWLVGLTASFIYNARVTKGRIQTVDVPLFKQSVLAHKRIVQYTFPSDAINGIANNILPILVIIYFSQAEVGIYSMAFTILSVPLMLLSGSVSRVYFQKAVAVGAENRADLYRLTQKVILPNVLIMLVFVLFMNTLGIYLLNLFLNDSWADLSLYILALSFWILARSAMNPISPIVMVIDKNHYSLIFNIYLLLVNFISLYFGVMKNDFLHCIWLFSILSGTGYLVLLSLVLINLRKK